MLCLPLELQIQILDLAVGYDPLSEYTLRNPTVNDQRRLRHLLSSNFESRVENAMQFTHKRCIATRKAFVLTCKLWSQVMQDKLLQVILLHNQISLVSLQRTLKDRPAFAAVIEALYIHEGASYSNQISDSISAILISIIIQCKNLKFLALEESFAEPNVTHQLLSQLNARRLESLRLKDTSHSIVGVLKRHPCLRTLEIFGDDLDGPSNLPFLQELAIRGSGPRFRISNLSSWNIISLTTLIIDCRNAFIGETQLEEAITPIAPQLLFFSIRAGILDVDLCWITQRCPNLETLCVSLALLNRRELERNATNGTTHEALRTIALINFSMSDEVSGLMALSKESFPQLSSVVLLPLNVVLFSRRVHRNEQNILQQLKQWHAQLNSRGIRLRVMGCSGKGFGNQASLDKSVVVPMNIT